jgi:predicted phage tail protein
MAPFAEVNGTCDVLVNQSHTVWELLQSVATTGRATPSMKDNKYSVIIDSDTRVPVQMFTPRNSSNLQSTRSYVDPPHALRVKWFDPASNYQEAEIIVYNTGHDASNTTLFEELTTFGMTRSEQVTRYGRYMLAQGLLRQERFQLTTDIENIVCVRGDLVYVAHDVIEVGGVPASTGCARSTRATGFPTRARPASSCRCAT